MDLNTLKNISTKAQMEKAILYFFTSKNEIPDHQYKEFVSTLKAKGKNFGVKYLDLTHLGKPMKAKKPIREIKIMFKVTEEEKEKILDNATLHTGGNLSEWIRLASLSFEG